MISENRSLCYATKLTLVVLLVFISRFYFRIDYNERDVLAFAYASFNPAWIINDWYLSTNIPYRNIFNYPAGALIQLFGFEAAAYIGRLISYVLFSVSFLAILKSIGIRYYAGILSLAVYFALFSDGIAAGEWIIGGFETKVFSYCFALLSLASMISGRVGHGLVFAGLSLSFHILVGGYNLVCLAPVLLFMMREGKLQIVHLLKNSYLFILAGLAGLAALWLALVDMIRPTSLDVGGVEPWDIYVQARVPHHTLPDWDFTSYLWMTGFAVILVTALLNSRTRDRYQYLCLYGLAGFCIMLLGLVIYYSGNLTLLRFYFFRFSDTILPLFAILVSVDLLLNTRWANTRTTKGLVFCVLAGILSFGLLLSEKHSYRYGIFRIIVRPDIWQPATSATFDPEMVRWIRSNTNPDDTFIIPPNLTPFYIDAQRPIVASYRSSPQSSESIREWSERIFLLNNEKELINPEARLRNRLRRNYRTLDEPEFIRIRDNYDASYLLVSAKRSLNFELAFSTEKYALYRLH